MASTLCDSSGLSPDHCVEGAANSLIQERLKEGCCLRFRVKTASMLPTLYPGDEVLVAAQPVQQVPLGALVVIQTGATWRVHRLIGRRPEGLYAHHSGEIAVRLQTKGDHCPIADAAFEQSDWIGVVQAIQKADRKIDINLPRFRRAGRWVAWLSALENHAHRARSAPTGRILLRLNRLLVDRLAGWMYGLGT